MPQKRAKFDWSDVRTRLKARYPIVSAETPPEAGHGFDLLPDELALCHELTRREAEEQLAELLDQARN